MGLQDYRKRPDPSGNSYYIDVIDLVVQDGAVLLPVKVVPGASRNAVLGEWNGRLRIAVAAAPEKGKANNELVAFLAKKLNVRKSQIVVVQGAAAPLKLIRIDRVAPETLRLRLPPDRS